MITGCQSVVRACRRETRAAVSMLTDALRGLGLSRGLIPVDLEAEQMQETGQTVGEAMVTKFEVDLAASCSRGDSARGLIGAAGSARGSDRNLDQSWR
jgi:hypothetical protein